MFSSRFDTDQSCPSQDGDESLLLTKVSTDIKIHSNDH